MHFLSSALFYHWITSFLAPTPKRGFVNHCMIFVRFSPSARNAKFHKFCRKWTETSCLALLLFVTVAGFYPTSSGGNLRDAASDLSWYMAPAMTARGVNFKIQVIRDTWLSSLGNDIALVLAPKTMDGANPAAKALVEQMHSAESLHAISQKLLGKCTVVASGQATGAGFPMALLVSALGDERLAWRVILLHESAHCVRNIAAENSEDLDKDRSGKASLLYSQLFALFLTEAYADSYSVLAIGGTGPSVDVQETARRLIDLRHSTASGPSYRTEGAIREAAALVAAKPSGAALWSPQEIDRLAMKSAIDGSLDWFRFMQIAPAQIAPAFIEKLKSYSDVRKEQ